MKREYDGFLADAFSLGVVVYAMALGNYPWQSTKPGRSRVFDWISCHGILPFLQRREMAQCFSEDLIELMAALLQTQPAQRLGLVQSGKCKQDLPTIWNCKWLASSAAQGQWRAISSNSVSTMATETESDAEEQGTGRPAFGFDTGGLAGLAC